MVKVVTKSESAGNISISFINTFTAESTTAALACARRGVILSQMLQTKGRTQTLMLTFKLLNNVASPLNIVQHQIRQALNTKKQLSILHHHYIPTVHCTLVLRYVNPEKSVMLVFM